MKPALKPPLRARSLQAATDACLAFRDRGTGTGGEAEAMAMKL